MGRGGEVEDIAPAIAFLISDEASYITGTGARFTNFQELFLTQILNAILNRLRIDS
jgi:hypothetical protein